jgi:hypothetical protein
MTWRGPWSATTAYNVNDAVSFNGSSWIAIQSNAGTQPTTPSAYWQLLAAKGEAGGTSAASGLEYKISGPITVPAPTASGAGQATGVAQCPAGKAPVGGGYFVSPDLAVYVTRSYPDLSQREWVVHVANPSPAVTLKVYAVCISGP